MANGYNLPPTQSQMLQQALANQFMGQGTSMAPVSTPMAGLARMLTGLVGAKMGKDVAQEQQARQGAFAQSLGDIISRTGQMPAGQAGPPQPLENVLANVQNPDVQQMLAPILLKQRLAGPTTQPGFTLGPGQRRFTATGEEVATAPFKTEDVGVGIGKIDPANYTLDSIAKFQTTKDFNDLVRIKQAPVEVGKIKPEKYTPESVEKYKTTRNFQDLVLRETPQERKQAIAEQKVETARQQSIAKVGRILDVVDDAMGQVDRFTTGLGGAVLGAIPGTSARDLQGTINTVQANLGFDTLQAMRDASPTGGALGQVSERELSLLTSAVQSLDPTQSPDRVIKNLQAVREHYNNWQQTLQQPAAQTPGPALQQTQQFEQPGVLPRTTPGGIIGQLPPGARQIGTSQGRPVYETPDGKRFIQE